MRVFCFGGMLILNWSCSAITHGMSHLIGQVAVGQFADLVLWKPENFGSKPEVVIKGGFIAWAQVSTLRSFYLH